MKNNMMLKGSFPSIFSEMDSVINTFFADSINKNFSFTKGDSFPRINAYKKNEKYFVEAAIAGIPKEDVSIDIDNRCLEFSYKKETKEEESEKNYFFREISLSAFKRKLFLPDSVDTESVKSSYDNGVIKLEFDIKEKAKKRSITIN